MKTVCENCAKMMRPRNIGITVLFQQPNENGEGAWPYSIHMADRYGCDGCGAVVLAGFAGKPVRLYWEKDFLEWLSRLDNPVKVTM